MQLPTVGPLWSFPATFAGGIVTVCDNPVD
jgi:hypothetical protein